MSSCSVHALLRQEWQGEITIHSSPLILSKTLSKGIALPPYNYMHNPKTARGLVSAVDSLSSRSGLSITSMSAIYLAPSLSHFNDVLVGSNRVNMFVRAANTPAGAECACSQSMTPTTSNSSFSRMLCSRKSGWTIGYLPGTH